jgi:hypothetical protein
MHFEVYCDESRQQLFADREFTDGRYVVISGIWIEFISDNSTNPRFESCEKRTACFASSSGRLSVLPDKSSTAR